MAILTSRSYVRATTILTSRSDVRDTKYLWGSRNTPSMKEGWICRTSYDEKNHNIAHMMMTIGDPYWAMIEIQLWWLWEIQIEWWSRSSLVMIQIEWWSRSSPVMMIQVEWWPRSSDDDLDWVMIQIQWWCPIMMIRIQWWWSRSRKEDGMKIKMTWRRRWLGDADNEKIRRRRPVMQIVSREYLPS